MSSRILLDTLVFSGSNKLPAVISFTPGLNVITGPSNTGKTLIFQCINYVLGSSKKPKSPPEAKGYTTIYLTIKANDTFFTIERSIQSSDVRIYPAKYDRIDKVESSTVPATASGTENLSTFLLNLIGIGDKRLKKNERNETVTLTFNILKTILLIGELKIQSEVSPIFSGANTAETYEKALFRFLLTGVDYSSVIAQEKSAIRKANASGRIELLSQLITRHKAELQNSSPLLELEGQLLRLDRSIALELLNLEQDEAKLANLAAERKQNWESAIQAESKLDQLRELKNRFELLDKYYDNDLSRLEAIVETGDALTNLGAGVCPCCGAAPENHQPNCVISDEEVNNVKDACSNERNKIQLLKADLQKTSDQVAEDIEQVGSIVHTHKQLFEQLDKQIIQELNPRVQSAQKNIAKLYDEKKIVEQSIYLQEHIGTLTGMLNGAERDFKAKTVKQKAEVGVAVAEAAEFVDIVYKILDAWSYPELARVNFSEIDQDFVIGDKSRIDQGKGYRALSHAAFIIALMEYCLAKNDSHPGFIVLDSPLVTFRGTDPDVTEEEGISVDLKDSFFNALSAMPNDRQIIIIDNDEPPTSIKDKINYIHFTKRSDTGRAGFIPS